MYISWTRSAFVIHTVMKKRSHSQHGRVWKQVKKKKKKEEEDKDKEDEEKRETALGRERNHEKDT